MRPLTTTHTLSIGCLAFEWVMGATMRMCSQGMVLEAYTMVEVRKQGPYALNEAYTWLKGHRQASNHHTCMQK